ncbi:MAG: hypothetical protein ABEJ61_07215 [Haloferacaceae archaeon]
MTRSRRAVLSAVGAGVAALAGCSALDVGDDAPAYDSARLADIGTRPVPRPPAAFPVALPDAMRARHRERARTLLERVPRRPAVPNGAVARRLREERERVRDELGGDDERDEGYEAPLDRLDDARGVRADAAGVEAAYRAATGSVDVDAVTGRRGRLRAATLAFERDWTYRGDDPATAVVVHRALEALLRDADRAVRPDRAFPDPPAADPFRAGEAVRDLEAGEAALADAERLRARHRDGLADPRPYRADVFVAVARIRRRGRGYRTLLHEYAAPEEGLPFERSIEGTALERLYREMAAAADRTETETTEARARGAPATALVEAGVGLARFRAFDAVVTAIREEELDPPTSAADVASARQAAVAALSAAWDATPTALAVELAAPARAYLARGTDDLGGRRADERAPDPSDAERAFANFVRAARYAAAVPRTVADVRAALSGDP